MQYSKLQVKMPVTTGFQAWGFKKATAPNYQQKGDC